MPESLATDPHAAERAEFSGRTSPRTLDAAATERLLSHLAQGPGPTDGRAGIEYLLFTCHQVPCAAPLHELREVLPTIPRSVALPFSPPWLLGIFPLRTELVGLVDPGPILFRGLALDGDRAATPPTTALIVGDGDALLGLAVTSVGDIALVHPDQLAPAGSSSESLPLGPYARARYVPPTGGPEYAVLDLPQLVLDLIRSVTEGAAHG